MASGIGSVADGDAARARLDSALSLELGAVERLVAEDAGEAGEGLLAGVPIIVKDMLDVGGVPTTEGSVGWSRRPREDAASVAALRGAGAAGCA